MDCPTCSKRMYRVQSDVVNKEDGKYMKNTFACPNKRCVKFAGIFLNNPLHKLELEVKLDEGVN